MPNLVRGEIKMSDITISHLDHIVLTVANIEVTCKFYSRILGMKSIKFGSNRHALMFGKQKINLHPARSGYDPKARMPTPGSGDLCFISETPINDVISHLNFHKIEIIEGPIEKTGALGSIVSVYFYDPDGNLVEVSNYN